MNANDFRKELTKLMPGYEWTVHRRHKLFPSLLEATGIQSSGFNRLSTLSVVRREHETGAEYEVKSSGFGTRAPWLHTNTDSTLARALRGLQTHYEIEANKYRSAAKYLQAARQASPNPDEGE